MDREKIINDEGKARWRCSVCEGLQEAVDWLSTETSLTVVEQWVVRDALALLKEQEPVEANCEHRCNKCKFYESVHNVMGHAPCSLWGISGVMWNDYCSRFNLWKESEVK